jgi:hypothetical protein
MGFFEAIDEVVNGWVAVAPRGDRAEREMMRLHNEWLRTECKLGVVYYGTTAEISWACDAYDEVFEFCDLKWTFVAFDKRRTHAITDTGASSVQVFGWALQAAGGQLVTGRHKTILTTVKPMVPPKPLERPNIRGDLRNVW